jgi:hypothetical protein
MAAEWKYIGRCKGICTSKYVFFVLIGFWVRTTVPFTEVLGFDASSLVDYSELNTKFLETVSVYARKRKYIGTGYFIH